MLFSKEYEDQKKVYAEGMERITISIQESVKDHIKVQHQQTFLTFVAILIALPCMIFVKDLELRTTMCNEAFASTVGKNLRS